MSVPLVTSLVSLLDVGVEKPRKLLVKGTLPIMNFPEKKSWVR